MFPRDFTSVTGCGCLVTLVQRGEFPPPVDFATKGNKQMVLFGGAHVPILGTIGTGKPDIWRCLVWGPGSGSHAHPWAYIAQLRSDVPNHPPTLEDILGHIERHSKHWSVFFPPVIT